MPLNIDCYICDFADHFPLTLIERRQLPPSGLPIHQKYGGNAQHHADKRR
jgi:hypothetical protein